MEKKSPQAIPTGIQTVAKSLETISEADRESNAEIIDSELISIMSIYEEEAKELPMSEYASTKVNGVDFSKIIFKVIELDLYTRESTPFTLLIQEDEKTKTHHPLKFIPIMRLWVFFPYSYPSHTAPLYITKTNWLWKECIQKLNEHLAGMWNEGELAVYDWVDYIMHGYLDSLDFAKGRLIDLPRTPEYHHLVEYLLFFSAQKEKEEFLNSEHDCPICLGTFPGSSFIRLAACKHFSCKTCFLAYCHSQIFEGKVSKMLCMEEECKKMIPETVLKEILDEETYEKYETFSINKALENLPDIAWCPQCEKPAFKESPDSLVAQCTVCEFKFCIKCNELYHPFERCKSLQVYESVDSGKFFEEAKKKNVNTMTKNLNNTLCNMYLNKYSKNCPRCKSPIMKAGGCNKVVCSSCQKPFCWLCLKPIEGYSHFEGKCPLFTAESLAEGETTEYSPLEKDTDELIKSLMEDVKESATQCPKCGQLNIKTQRLNLVTCTSCEATFCHFCGIEATEEHFEKSTCLKFS